MKTNLLKELRIGQKVYSPIFGEGVIVCLDSDEIYGITVRTFYGSDFEFDQYGHYAIGGEQVLFIK